MWLSLLSLCDIDDQNIKNVFASRAPMLTLCWNPNLHYNIEIFGIQPIWKMHLKNELIEDRVVFDTTNSKTQFVHGKAIYLSIVLLW